LGRNTETQLVGTVSVVPGDGDQTKRQNKVVVGDGVVGSFALKSSTLQLGAVAEALPVWENGTNACWGVAFLRAANRIGSTMVGLPSSCC
jgi:hypothetical protein